MQDCRTVFVINILLGMMNTERIIAAKIYSINSDGYVKNCYDDETVYIASALHDALREWDCI